MILTTDADSRAPSNWIVGNLLAIDAGADAVLGRMALDKDSRSLPESLQRRGALESEYEALPTECRGVGPRLAQPVAASFHDFGGERGGRARKPRGGSIPRVPLGEDKALVAELLSQDARVRFDSAIEVITSARTEGRATGGVADTLRLRTERPNFFCDEVLEPYGVAERRAHWRGRLRRLWAAQGASAIRALIEELAIPAIEAERLANKQAFGAAWAIAERSSPFLRRQLLRPSNLPREIAAAREGLQLKPQAWPSDGEATVKSRPREAG